MKRLWLALSAAVTALLLVATACAGDDNVDEDLATTAAATDEIPPVEEATPTIEASVQLAEEPRIGIESLKQEASLAEDILDIALDDDGNLLLLVQRPAGLQIVDGGSRIDVALVGGQAPGSGVYESFSDVFPSYAISSRGAAAFVARLEGDATMRAFAFNAGQVRELAPDRTDKNPAESRRHILDMNRPGDVLLADGAGLYLAGSNDSVTEIVRWNERNASGYTLGFLAGAGFQPRNLAGVVNDEGEIAFAATLSDEGNCGVVRKSDCLGIFLYSQGTLTKVIAVGDVTPDGGVFGFANEPELKIALRRLSFDLNNRGELVFAESIDERRFTTGSGWSEVTHLRTYLFDGQELETLPITSAGIGGVWINEPGEIVLCIFDPKRIVAISDRTTLEVDLGTIEAEQAFRESPDAIQLLSLLEFGGVCSLLPTEDGRVIWWSSNAVFSMRFR